MPRLPLLPGEVAPAALRTHRRRIESLELRRGKGASATPPPSPTVGQRWLVAHATGVWEMAWTGAVWAFVGGADLVAYTDAEVATSSTSYPSGGQGPSVTPPRAGTFDLYLEARHRHSHTAILFTSMLAMQGAVPKGQARSPVIAPGAQLVVGSWTTEAAGATLAASPVGMAFACPNGAAFTTWYGWRQIRVRPRTLV
jgi:hypothetical protein